MSNPGILGNYKESSRAVDLLLIVIVFTAVVLMALMVLQEISPPSTNIEKLREEFNSKFGTDRQTVREAEYYRVVEP